MHFSLYSICISVFLSLTLSPSLFLSHCLQLTWAQFSLTVLAARGKVIWIDPQCFKGLCQSRETPCVFVLLILMAFWGAGRFRTVLMCQWMKYCCLQLEEIAGMTLHMEAKQKNIQKQHQPVALPNQYYYCLLWAESISQWFLLKWELCLLRWLFI